jgi:hypothetical protein
MFESSVNILLIVVVHKTTTKFGALKQWFVNSSVDGLGPTGRSSLGFSGVVTTWC